MLQTLTGKTIVLEVASHSSVGHLKKQIEAKEGIPPREQRFVYTGRQLEDQHTLAHYNVILGSTLHLILRLRGGGSEPFADVSNPGADLHCGCSLTVPTQGCHA